MCAVCYTPLKIRIIHATRFVKVYVKELSDNILRLVYSKLESVRMNSTL